MWGSVSASRTKKELGPPEADLTAGDYRANSRKLDGEALVRGAFGLCLTYAMSTSPVTR